MVITRFVNLASLAMLVKGLKDVLDEHGFERARSDANWLNNILADYSPQTLALNVSVRWSLWFPIRSEPGDGEGCMTPKGRGRDR